MAAVQSEIEFPTVTKIFTLEMWDDVLRPKKDCEMSCNMLINKVVKLIWASGLERPPLAPSVLHRLQAVGGSGVLTRVHGSAGKADGIPAAVSCLVGTDIV
jgi:hypothetical protein